MGYIIYRLRQRQRRLQLLEDRRVTSNLLKELSSVYRTVICFHKGSQSNSAACIRYCFISFFLCLCWRANYIVFVMLSSRSVFVDRDVPSS
jgi:hypothetical protein